MRSQEVFCHFLSDQSKQSFLSNPYQHALALWQKLREVIIINYQLSSWYIFSLFSNLANQWHYDVIRFIWFVLSITIKMDNHRENLAWVTLLQNRMIFNCHCYWPLQWFTSFSNRKVFIRMVVYYHNIDVFLFIITDYSLFSQ